MRWYDHLSRLRRGLHHCAALQAEWNLSGPESFGWQILEADVSRQNLVSAEQRWLDETSMAYNAARRAGGGPRDGFKHTAESKALMVEAKKAWWSVHRDVKLSPEHREALRRSNIGRRKTLDERKQMSETSKGRVITWGAKISAARIGKPMSAAAREAFERTRISRGLAISQGKKGKPWSPARRATWLAKKMA